MDGTVFWAYTSTSYETAKDIKRGEYHLVAAEGELFTSSGLLEQHIASKCEAERQQFLSDVAEDDVGELPLDNPNDKAITADTLEWHEETLWDGRRARLTICEYSETVFVAYKMESIG